MEIGAKIKKIRLQTGFTQEELADRCELTKGFISQLENDITSPSISTLVDILTALGTTIDDFFSEKNREQIVFKKDDIFQKEDTDLGIVISWLIPNAQKNDMEPIMLDMKRGSSTNEYDPNESEFFGYVIDGQIIVHIGDKQYIVNQGESFYMIKPAKYSLVAKKASKVIWVSSPPIF